MHDIYPRELVVGVDGSQASKHALGFAMREAGLRRSTLHVVTVWKARDTDTDTDTAAPVGGAEQRRERAQHLQDAAVASALSEVEARPVLMRSVVSGDAGEVLCEMAVDADYLVVGGGRVASTSTVALGAVGEFCLHHAGCALVVVSRAAPSEAAWQPTPRLGYVARARAS
jgi:nucleotide-binding universal stress UspA family protein